MPTIIDALVIKLGLDSSDFEKGQKQTQEGLKKVKTDSTDTAKVMQEQGKKAGAFFGSIRNELLALVGISLSIKGFKDLIIGTATNFSQLGRSSNMLGMSAKRLDAWQYAAKAFGGTAEGLVGTMSSLSQGINSFALTGEANGVVTALNALGVAATDKDGKLRTSEDILMDLSDKFKAMTPQQTQYFSSMLGIDAGSMNLLMQGRDGVKALVDELAKSSGVTDDAIKRSQQFQVTWARIEQRFSSVREKLFTALIPYIEKLLGLLDRFSTWISSHQEEINAFFTNSAAEIGKVVDAVGGLQNAFEILLAFMVGKWALGMLGTLGKVSGALGPIVAAIATINAYNKVNSIQEEAKASKMSVGDYLIKKNKDFESSEVGNTPGDKIIRWWNSVTGGYSAGEYSAYGTKAPRGIRNNNPGNLNYAGQRGAEKESGPNGRFAVFQSMTDGVAALYKQLNLYFQRGTNTIESIVKKYAPASDGNNVMSYITSLMKATGKKANEVLSAEDMQTMFALIKGIINHENGAGFVPDHQIAQGIQVGAGVSAQRNSISSARQTTTITNESHVGQLIVQPKSTDGPGIGREIRSDLQRNGLVFNTDSGMS
ncbi:LysM domain-containing protein [Yersinia massiliensis]|uniref:hypothetical protein n=1 Tax=Yersinia massiliensis TaxID=419257 RepID=UPI0005E0BC13|nr:hypothetical protein [Yersinia massiliensis]CNI67348.1 LysM domain-containing protein [Yersinia massiliensis]